MSRYRCDDFLALLASATARRPGADESLAWHRHLVECASCRGQLAAEERLEELLASISEPEVPPDLADRIQAALLPMRKGLSRREEELDRLLDRVPKPAAPAGLADRVLARLEPERTARRVPAALPWQRRSGVLAAAAALLLVVFVASRLLTWSSGDVAEEELAYFREVLENEDELIVYALENWELLMNDEIEVYLSLGPEEQALFELGLLDDPVLSSSQAEEEQ